MEKKIYSGYPILEQLDIGDSLVNFDKLNWEFICEVPDDVAATWMFHFTTSHISTKSTVAETPIKDWQQGVGIIIGSTPDFIKGRERLVLLLKGKKDFFSILRSKTDRNIRIETI